MRVAADRMLEVPFLGLRYFDEEHSHLFFGRDAQVNDILEKLLPSRLVTVMGSSGSGKSSLVRAGLVRSLKSGFLGTLGPSWRIAKMRPGSSPIASLGRGLEKALSVSGLEVTLRRGPLGLVQAVGECRLPAGENVLVVADQFEELFRYQRESIQPDKAKEEAAAFVKLLLEATSQRALPIYVVVTMRSDYLGDCAQFRDLPERINDGLYLVPRMRRDQLEQAITGPVAVADAEIAPRLVQQLLNETGDDPDQLPLLQHALLRAWNHWGHAPRALDLQDLDDGGMSASLSRHADEIFNALTPDQQGIARVIFQQLGERDAEGREIRRPAPVVHVAAVAAASVEAVEEVVAKFAAPDAALLYRNEGGDLDITHESLLRKWGLIQGTRQGAGQSKGWMQEEVEARDEFRMLVERTSKKDTLMGRALEDAIQWRTLGLNADWARRYTKTSGAKTTFQEVLQFIEECRMKDAARRRRRRWLVIGAVASAVVVLVLISILWLRAKEAAAEAERQTSIAKTSAAEAERITSMVRELLAKGGDRVKELPEVLFEASIVRDGMLMWTRADNGEDVDWYGARKYCTELRLGDYSNWRMPTIAELEKLYDPKTQGIRTPFPQTIWVWSSERQGSGSAFAFRFVVGKRHDVPLDLAGDFLRALCVRGSGE
jgi:hypothetical protein